MLYMGPDTIFLIHLTTTGHLVICTIWKEQTGSFSCIYTLLHQQGKMLKCGVTTHKSAVQTSSYASSPMQFGNLWVLHQYAFLEMPSVCPVLSHELKSFMGTSRQRITNLDRSCAVPLAPIFSRERSTCNRIKQQWVTGIYKNDCNSVHSDKKKSILNPLSIMLFM